MPLEFLIISCFLTRVSFIFWKQQETPETLGQFFAKSIINLLIDKAMQTIYPSTIEISDLVIQNREFFAKQDYLKRPDMIRYGDLVTYLFIYKQFRLIRCFDCLNACLGTSYTDQSCEWCSFYARSWCRHFQVMYKSMMLVKTYVDDVTNLPIMGRVDFTYRQSRGLLNDEMILASLAAQASLSEPDLRFFEKYGNLVRNLSTHLSEICSSYDPIYHQVARGFCHSHYKNLCFLRVINSTSQIKKRTSLHIGFLRLKDKMCVVLHPASLILHTQTNELPPFQFVIYGELTKTSQCFIKHTIPLEADLVRNFCGEWLARIGFSYDEEVISEHVFENLGPSILKELSCNHFKRLKEIEEDLNTEVAAGSILLIDHDNYSLKLWTPKITLQLAMKYVEAHIESIKKALHMIYTIHITLGRGSILMVVEPGCIVREIIFSRDCLMFKMMNLPKNELFKNFETRLRSMFDFKWISFKRRQKAYTDALIYFNNAAEVDVASEALKITPVLNGFGRPINLEPMLNLSESAQFTIKLQVPPDTHDTTIKEILEFYGKVQYFKVIRSQRQADVIVRFKSSRTAKAMLYNYQSLAKDLFPKGDWHRCIFQLHEFIDIPAKLIEAAGLDLRERLIDIETQYDCCLRGNSNSYNDRLYLGPSLPKDIIDQLSILLREDLVFLGNFATLSLSRGGTIPENKRERTLAEWEEHFHVKATIYHTSYNLGIYGLPENRNLARVNLENYIKHVNSTNTTKCVRYNSTEKLNAIFASVANYRDGVVLFNHNAAARMVLLEGSLEAITKILGRTFAIQSSKKDCSICLNSLSIETQIVLEMCGHQFHKDCLKLQLMSAVSNRLAPELPVSCILCHTALVPKDWLTVLEEFDLYKLQQCAIDMYLATMPVLSRCENMRCFYVYNKDDLYDEGETIRDCPECNMKWCTQCRAPVFSNSHDIACQDRWLESNDPQTQAWVKANTVVCPICRYPSVKGTGCNHMTCTRCRGHYCYLCGSAISAADPNSHFMVKGDPCYGKLFLES
mmetsp:Transcript_23810/g.42142  ORF Transcript_23810/g.42142 Transcript_23810/m.42142 type:complete len:1022 (+) Transcript_23810:1-3066(+)